MEPVRISVQELATFVGSGEVPKNLQSGPERYCFKGCGPLHYLYFQRLLEPTFLGENPWNGLHRLLKKFA